MPAIYSAVTRFYLPSTGAPGVSPAYDASWEQTGEADRISMVMTKIGSALTNAQRTVPITTTQDILTRQFVSEPVPFPVTISGMISMVIRDSESLNSANAYLAYSLRSWNPITSAFQAIASKFTTTGQTEDPVTASAATKIWSAQAPTNVTLAAGDYLVFEVGIRANAPTAGNTAIRRFGDPTDTADFALTAGLTTDLCPWMEIAQDLYGCSMSNQQYFRVKGGMSSTERWR